MTGRIYTSDHRVYDLPPLLSWTVDQTGTVPCDSFSVTFLYQPEMTAALHLAAGFAGFQDGSLVTRGVVDGFEVTLDGDGVVATLSGRGYAARLLDNESRPVTYQGATLAELVRQHVTPYGITAEAVADVRAEDVYTVAAGSSQWKALEGFCRAYGGFTPRFSVSGTLLAAPETDDGRRLCLGEGDPILSCGWQEDRYGVLTEALVIDKTRGVSYSVQNQDLLDRGGQCRRVIYTPGQSTWAAMRYTGEYQIQQSRQEERTLTVTLAQGFPASPGDRVTVDLPRLGVAGTFRVAEAVTRLSPRQGTTATLTLREVE